MRIARLQSRPTLVAVLAAAATSLVLAPVATADVGEQIILRCTHGESLSGFSQKDYSRALQELSADAEEYTACSSQIRKAQEAAASGRRGGVETGAAQSSVATAASPTEQKAVAKAIAAGATPLRLGGQVIHPGVVNTGIASAFSSLPTPLLAMLAFLLACLLAVAAGAVRNRIRGRRSD